jgi:predicted nucleic acid-binding protein
MTQIVSSSANKPVLLDASPLGTLAHPRPNPEIVAWLEGLLVAGVTVIVPSIADYEVRRNMLAEKMIKSIARLDILKTNLLYQPLSDTALQKAAELWAISKRAGKLPADPKELNCDVILAAQALEVGGMIATENIGHLSQFVEAKHWKDITLS